MYKSQTHKRILAIHTPHCSRTIAHSFSNWNIEMRRESAYTTSRLAHTAPSWKVNIEQSRQTFYPIYLVGEFQIGYASTHTHACTHTGWWCTDSECAHFIALEIVDSICVAHGIVSLCELQNYCLYILCREHWAWQRMCLAPIHLGFHRLSLIYGGRTYRMPALLPMIQSWFHADH